MSRNHPFSIRLADDERAALERAAQAERRALAGMARKAVADWLIINGWLDKERANDG